MAIGSRIYSAPPHPEQNRAPGGLVCWQRPQASIVPGCVGAALPAAGIFTVRFTGCPHPGNGMPSAAAIPAA